MTSFHFILLRESVSANGLIVVYPCPAECEVFLSETLAVKVAVSEI